MYEKIAYVEHPVTAEEKAELRMKGFNRFIDIAFKPEALPANAEIIVKKKATKKQDAI